MNLTAIESNKNLREEEKVLKYLTTCPKDFIGAFNQTGLTLFYVNSYSSYLFNKAFEELHKKNLIGSNFPVIGYKTKFSNKEVETEYMKLMAKEDISMEDFFNKDYSELSYSGRERQAYYSVKDFKCKKVGDNIILKFCLPMGAYANLFLERIIIDKQGELKLE
jgi:tRNA(Glu) U13 pseudouridine synthase TruD